LPAMGVPHSEEIRCKFCDGDLDFA